MAKALAAWTIAIALAVTPAAAADQQAPEVAGMRWLVGSWRGAGAMFGRPSEAELDVHPSLGGGALELRYRAGGFEGRAHYLPAGEGRWRAAWSDNRGVSFAIEASSTDRTLVADWGAEATERGRTVYRLDDRGLLEVSDSVWRDGALRPFASHTLSRAD